MNGRLRPGEMLTGLARARRTASLYGAQHPVAVRTTHDVHSAIVELLGARPSLRLFIYDATFYVGRTLLLEESLRLGALLTELSDRQIGMIEFQTGVEVGEVAHLIDVLNLRPSDLQRLGGAAAALQQREVRRIAVSSEPPHLAEEQFQVRLDPRDVYRAGLRVVDELYHQASHDLPLDLKKAGMVVSSLIDVMTEDRTALLGIAALRLYDEETAHHSVNVAVLSLLIGMHLQLERPLQNALGLAALLHDIGKVRIPREILTKQEPPTAEERVQVRRHTLYGAHLLRNLPGLLRLAMVVAFEHHANFNLSGYPRIAAKTAPHPITCIVQLADFYDAATASVGSVRCPMLPHEAVTFILERAGTIFDPALVPVFVRAVGRYPAGSLVELSSGETAVVVGPGEQAIERPMVKIVADPERQPLVPRTLSLEGMIDLHIVRAVDPAEVGFDTAAYL